MLRRLSLLSVCLLLLAGPVIGQDSDAPKIKQARAAIAQRLAAEEVACYQKFAVNDCLRRARRQARLEQLEVQRSESAIKEGERLQRSARHRQELSDKRASSPTGGVSQAAPTKPRTAKTPIPKKTAPQVRVHPAKDALSERAARQRARDEQAVKARQRLLDKQGAAAERDEARTRRQTQREAKGRPSAAPLPDSN